MFWVRNDENRFPIRTLIWGLLLTSIFSIFKFFPFTCHGNRNSDRNQIISTNLKENHPSIILEGIGENLSRCGLFQVYSLLIDFSLTVKAATLIFISGRGLAK